MNLFALRIARVVVNLIIIACLAISSMGNTGLVSYAKTQPSSKFDPENTQKVKDFSQEKTNLEPVKLDGASQRAESKQLGSSNYKIQPILFVPSDQQETSNNESSINSTFKLIRQWYAGALEQNNKTYVFNLENAIVFKASQPLSYYKCINHEITCDNFDGLWVNTQTELLNSGYPLWQTGYSHIIFVKGGGGWSGSSCTPNCYANWPSPGPASTSGVSLLGDWALDAISGTVNRDCYAELETACFDQSQRGAIAHELGHTFGLAHSIEQEGSVMSSWWLFPYVTLANTSGNDEKSLLKQSPFFNQAACTYDSSLVEMVQPTSITTGTQFSSIFSIENNGLCAWKKDKTSLTLIKDKVWGITSIPLQNDVKPGQTYNFYSNMKAPALGKRKLSEVKRSDWQLKIGRNFIGLVMGSSITITK